LLRLGALAAAAVLALTSRGDAYVLAALLAVGSASRVAALGVVLGLVAISVRYGSSSLEAIAGAQAVLGPAGTTGSTPGVAAAWLAATTVAASALHPRVEQERTEPGMVRTTRWVSAVSLGSTAAAVVVGPGSGGAVDARVVASVVAVVLVGVIGELGALTPRSRRRRPIEPVDALPPVLGLAALVLAVASR
jgi:hypothetical protein